ncbi:MAG: DUF2800 domain-containing protein [Oscillospiraceae bacterium]|nr:DUF2800 domain-containing protein [Oscillospiraceae bacterium]MBQ6428398.1 DUF2800 domain-containing protein [Oscillospiraceae bacterium]
MPRHAYLSASASHRWLACPPSAKLCAEEPDYGSEYAMQGTCAHELSQYLLEKALGRPCVDPTENLSYYDAEMQECAEGYRDFVLEQIAEAKKSCRDPLICVEQVLDFSKWVEHGFGTGDCVIVADGTLHIIDLKYGVGVLVHAKANSQLMCYALGALDTFGDLYEIHRIRLSIYQPRRENVDSWELDATELLDWAENVLKPAAKLAYAGDGEFHAGEHCVFCKIKASCRKRAEYALELAKEELKEPAKLTEEEIATLLPKVETLVSWAEDLKAFALKSALKGVSYPGWKLAEGRSVRRFRDERKVAEIVSAAGYDPYEKKLLGITAMTKQLGKKRFDELLKDYVVKPQGKPVLVPENDKRPAFNAAELDFKEYDMEDK